MYPDDSLTLHTDLYQINMMQVYFRRNIHESPKYRTIESVSHLVYLIPFHLSQTKGRSGTKIATLQKISFAVSLPLLLLSLLFSIAFYISKRLVTYPFFRSILSLRYQKTARNEPFLF